MANFLQFGAFVLTTAFLCTCILGTTDGRIIRLDLNSDQDSGFWSEVSCKYSADHVTYNNSCPMKLRPDAAAFNGRDGFWSPCGAGKCDITYYGNSFPQPKSIKLHGMVGGGGKIIVQGRRSPVGQAYENDVMEMTSKDTDTKLAFTEISKETSEFKNSFAFRFALVAQTGKSIAVLDFIELDLGEDVPEPEPPTTQAPDLEKTEFFLDTRSDVSSNWKEISCNYAETPEDLWVWGCPKDMESSSAEDSLGYWAPCATTSCRFVYHARNNMEHPSEITINGTLEEGSTVVVSRKLEGLNHPSVILISVEVEETTDSWTFDVPYMYEDDLYNITIVRGSKLIDGNVPTVLVDSILVKVSSDLPEAPTTTTTTTTTEITTTTVETETTPTEDNGGETGTTSEGGNETGTTSDGGNETGTTSEGGNETGTTSEGGNETGTTPEAGSDPTTTPGSGNEPITTPGTGSGSYTFSSFTVTFVAAVLAVAVSIMN